MSAQRLPPASAFSISTFSTLSGLSRRHQPDHLVADGAVAAGHEGFGYAIDAPFDRAAAIAVDADDGKRIAVSAEKAAGVVGEDRPRFGVQSGHHALGEGNDNVLQALNPNTSASAASAPFSRIPPSARPKNARTMALSSPTLAPQGARWLVASGIRSPNALAELRAPEQPRFQAKRSMDKLQRIRR